MTELPKSLVLFEDNFNMTVNTIQSSYVLQRQSTVNLHYLSELTWIRPLTSGEFSFDSGLRFFFSDISCSKLSSSSHIRKGKKRKKSYTFVLLGKITNKSHNLHTENIISFFSPKFPKNTHQKSTLFAL